MTTSPKQAWYLRITEDLVGDHAVLVGDRGRALLATEVLTGAEIHNEDRGLTTVVGRWQDQLITVAAFGMGAPIAAAVLHELADLGISIFVRAGTMLSYGETPLGSTIVADGSLIHEGTSRTYGADTDRAEADRGLVAAAKAGFDADRTVFGLTASCDGFYTQMTEVLGPAPAAVELRRQWDAEGVIGVDMETAAIYSAARALGTRALSVCLASVDGRTSERLVSEARVAKERQLLIDTFDLLVADQEGAVS